MDRLKLETAYRRTLDVLMSAVDERQLQGAIIRLLRLPSAHRPSKRALSQTRLHTGFAAVNESIRAIVRSVQWLKT